MKDENRELYSLIISQLVCDGLVDAANVLSEATMIPIIDQNGSNRLSTLVQSSLAREVSTNPNTNTSTTTTTTTTSTTNSTDDDMTDSPVEKAKGLDFESQPTPKTNPNFATMFITTHKNVVRCARFSPDGRYIATGSEDTSIKLLEVAKLKSFGKCDTEAGAAAFENRDQMQRPVLKTFYDHTQPINDLDFHPYLPYLISSSKDCTVMFYDFRSSVKRAFKYIQDTHNIRTISLHPCGDYLLVGTDHPVIRLYDVNTFQAYTSKRSDQHHFAPINMVRYSPDGTMWASCSKDGSIKLWDSVSNSLINTIPNAHNSSEVNSVQFTISQKYLLTCGKDESVRLWEWSTGRQILKITTGHPPPAGGTPPPIQHRANATFNYNEDFIIGSDDVGGVVWDSRTGDVIQRLQGHANLVRYVAASPTENALITCSNDHRGRFWASFVKNVNVL
eukprot:TRINITY_DN1607_c0_g3_i1.p1 TRINITY_DN1607_c0_g3~~TRINITY_DN1607_c0_g3_i1.p1  ORF type:complete len:447 (+),score=89.78 TRINITY_DN1607_c0_g3_i1:195-1535(+)